MNTKNTTGHRHNWYLATCISLFMLMLAPAAQARTVTVNVNGMTCEVCVIDLQRKLSILPQVKAVSINLKKNQVRLITTGATPSSQRIKKAILEAGFMPLEIQENMENNQSASTTQ